MGPDGGVRGSCWHNDSFVIIEGLFCGVRELLSVSASRGPVFQPYLFNRWIDQDETWAHGVSSCGLIFHNILLKQKIKISSPCHWLLMLKKMWYVAICHPFVYDTSDRDQRSGLVNWAGLINGSRIAA